MIISQIKHFYWKIVIDIPILFITMIMMMLNNSIAYGISFGVSSFVILNISLGLAQKYLCKNNDKKSLNH